MAMMTTGHKTRPLTDDTTLVLLRCMYGRDRQMILDCTQEQFWDGMKAYTEGAYMQDAFRMLNPIQREYLLTGLTDDEFQEAAGSEF